MLSSSPAVPISSFSFADGNRRRLSFVTENGKEMYTAHDGLPSPQHLTPIAGNTAEHTPEEGTTPNESPQASTTVSRRTSNLDEAQDGGALRKVPSRGGLWHDEVSNRYSLPLSSGRLVCFWTVLAATSLGIFDPPLPLVTRRGIVRYPLSPLLSPSLPPTRASV